MVAILEVVEVAAKEVLSLVKPQFSQFIDTLALTLFQCDHLVDHRLGTQIIGKHRPQKFTVHWILNARHTAKV